MEHMAWYTLDTDGLATVHCNVCGEGIALTKTEKWANDLARHHERVSNNA
jgi:hypothetical protein